MNEYERRRRFEELFDRHFRALLGYTMRRVEDPAAAADVVAEIFLVVWRRLEEIPPDPEAKLWLYGTARRVLSNHYRSERRRSDLVDKLRTHLGAVVSDHPDESAVHVRTALDRLDADDAELLRLTAWEGLSPGELARIWSIPATTVRTRLHRARMRLKAQLDGERTAVTGHVGVDRHTPIRGPEEES